MSRTLSIAFVAGITLIGFAPFSSAATITCGSSGGGICTGNIMVTIGPALVDFGTGHDDRERGARVSHLHRQSEQLHVSKSDGEPTNRLHVHGFDVQTLGDETLNLSASNGGSFTINDPDDFKQIKDVQISGLAPVPTPTAVPSPIVGAGLPGLISALLGMVVLACRRRLSLA